MEYSSGNVDLMGIHELRDFARKVGVSGPTQFRKEDLFKEVNNIVIGKTDPNKNRPKKGRPAKPSLDTSALMDLILPRTSALRGFDDNPEYDMSNEKFAFVLNMDAAKYVENNESKEYEGDIELKPEGYGVVHVSGICPSDEDVFVGKTLVKQNALKTGERVKVVARLIKEGYPEVAYELTRLSQPTSFDFDTAEHEKLKDGYNVDINISNFKLGGRYFIKTDQDPYEIVPQLAKSISAEIPNVLIKTFYLNAIVERINSDGVDTEYVPFNKLDQEMVVASNMFLEKCKRMAEENKNVVVILSGFSQLAKACNCVNLKSNNYLEISPKTVYKAKNILAMAKRISDESSISIVFVDDMRVPKNITEMFEYEIMPLF